MIHPSQPCAADCLSKRMNFSVCDWTHRSITKQNSCYDPACKLCVLIRWGTSITVDTPHSCQDLLISVNTGTCELLPQHCAAVPAVSEGKHFQGDWWDSPVPALPRQVGQHTTRTRSWANSDFLCYCSSLGTHRIRVELQTLWAAQSGTSVPQEGGSEGILQAEPWQCQRGSPDEKMKDCSWLPMAIPRLHCTNSLSSCTDTV